MSDNETKSLITVTAPEITQYSTDMSIEQGKELQAFNVTNVIQNIFGMTANQGAAAQKIANMYQIKHGLTASVPILCKSPICPYEKVCRIPFQDRQINGRCVQEVGAMVARFEALCRELAVTDDDAVDMGLVKDVVDIEMQILRVDNKMAISGDMLAETILFVDSKGAEHKGQIADPLFDMKLKLLDRKTRILEKLNSTRKDKADEMKKKKDPSVKSANLMQRVKLIQQQVRQSMENQEPVITENNTLEIEVTETGDQYDSVEV